MELLYIRIQISFTKTFHYGHYYLFDYHHRFHSKYCAPSSHYNHHIFSPVGACPLAEILEGPQELVKSHNESFPLCFVVLKRTVSPAHLEKYSCRVESNHHIIITGHLTNRKINQEKITQTECGRMQTPFFPAPSFDVEGIDFPCPIRACV